MWIVKGALLGTLFFIVTGISYMYIRIRIGMYLYAHGHTHGTLPYFESTQLLHNPLFWLTLLIAIAIGLWIMKKRAQRRNLRSHAAV